MRVGAAPADGRAAWTIGVQKPEGFILSNSENDMLAKFAVSDMSIVTSGDYQRYYTVEGRRYHHLIDPRTLMPGAYYRAVTILTADSGLADLLSTAAFLLPYEESRALIEGLDGVEALWVMPDESIVMTDGAQALARSLTAPHTWKNPRTAQIARLPCGGFSQHRSGVKRVTGDTAFWSRTVPRTSD